MNFKDIELFVKEVQYDMYLEVYDHDWFLIEDTVFWWNKEEWAAEYREGTLVQEDYTMINVDNGCGDSITYVFPSGKKMTEEMFINKYEGM